jgi:putative lipoic acid-binding regulatory protein
MSQQQDPLTFPCRFPIKIMGRGDEAFEFAVVQILRKHLPQLAEGAIRRRDSRQSNYAALTIEIEAKSREQLDAIYRDLSACDQVLMTL